MGPSHWTAEPYLLLGWWGDSFSSVQSRARDLESKHNTHFNQSSVSSPTHTSTCRNPCGVQSLARLWLWCTSVCFQAFHAPLLVSGSSALLHHDQCHCFPDSEMVSLLLPAHFLSLSRFLALFSLLYCSLVYFQEGIEIHMPKWCQVLGNLRAFLCLVPIWRLLAPCVALALPSLGTSCPSASASGAGRRWVIPSAGPKSGVQALDPGG